jgi:hypothetical protein
MTKHIKHIIEGARQVLVLMPAERYVIPSKSDFLRDVKVLRQDANQIARDINKTIKKHGK